MHDSLCCNHGQANTKASSILQASHGRQGQRQRERQFQWGILGVHPPQRCRKLEPRAAAYDSEHALRSQIQKLAYISIHFL